MNKRKSFQDLPHEENETNLQNGKVLYYSLKLKYPNQTIEDLDSILNSLCAALICLIGDSVDKDDYQSMLQLVHKILNKNLTGE